MRHAKKNPEKPAKKIYFVKPHCPFKHLRIYNSSLLIIFLKQNEVQKYILLQINGEFTNWIFLFWLIFGFFQWGIKERFQLLTSPCILIFKEILLQLRALNGDNMVYILQCCYCSFMMYIIYMSSDLQHILSDGINTDCLNALFSFTYTIFKLIKQLQ